MKLLHSSRMVSGARSGKTRASLTTMRHVTEVERECTDIRQHLVLKTREQAAEAQLQHRRYEEAKSPFAKVKQLCSQPKRKKKTRSSGRKKALEMQMASLTRTVVDPPTSVQRMPSQLFQTSSAPSVEASSLSFTSSSVKTGLSFKALFRRYSSRNLCSAAYGEDFLNGSSGDKCTRSARSFIGESYRSVETF